MTTPVNSNERRITLHSAFSKINEEKQRRIINAALNEFSKQPYETASTNKIVQEAGISKGLLFHYFGNKKNLYLFLYEYVVDKYSETTFRDLDLTEPNIFKRYKQLLSINMHLALQNPAFFQFISMVQLEKNTEVTSELEALHNVKENYNYDKFLSGIDYSLFKEGIDPKYALSTINFVLDGISNKYNQQLKDANYDLDVLTTLTEECAVEMEEYFQFLKPLFYQV